MAQPHRVMSGNVKPLPARLCRCLSFCLSSRFAIPVCRNLFFLFVILERSEGSAVAFAPAVACSPNPTPKFRHLDRSNGQLHRPVAHWRDPRIRFRLCLVLFVCHLVGICRRGACPAKTPGAPSFRALCERVRYRAKARPPSYPSPNPSGAPFMAQPHRDMSGNVKTSPARSCLCSCQFYAVIHASKTAGDLAHCSPSSDGRMRP
jgi:hypothetical protein